MTTTISLKTEESFKAFMEHIALEYHGFKGNLIEALETCGFDNGYVEEYKHCDISNIVDYGYDEADDETYCNWLPFPEKSATYFLGDYYVSFDDSFDRMGDIATRMFIKLETPTLTGSEWVERYKSLISELTPIAKKMDEISTAVRNKDTILTEELTKNNENLFKQYEEITERLEEIGVGMGLK